ncbi:branched-chain amino acid transport system II carrier protein [Helcococcus kunzii]|uniref:branched-chain amino acid transport system II carrier protein n=1 Tax=Helcococcus kunzii TaxID=40091 RepID=UPI0038A30CD2
MERKLTRSEFISLSIMLFGLFFGAGNLIFPPMLGFNSGNKTIVSFIFFTLTAIIFPVLGVITVSKTNGLQNLAKRVHPAFALVFTIVIYLSIGPGLGIPRAGVVPFEMAIFQYLPKDFDANISRLIYTLIFFSIAYYVSLSPNKLVKRSGKILTPILISLILILFVGILFKNPNNVGLPKDVYAKSPAIVGFVEGYNTLDAIAALNFGLVISLTLRKFNIKNEKEIVGYTIKSGFLAGFILLLIYAILSYIGMMISGSSIEFENGAQILSYISESLYGQFGVALIILIFTLACLTTSIGLIVSISEYFATLTNKINEKTWALIVTLFAFIVSNFGLNAILSITVPVLQIVYPFSLVIIIMGLLHDKIGFTKATYVVAAIVSFAIAIFTMLINLGLEIPFFTGFISTLPFYNVGLNWVIPTIISIFFTQLISKK